MVAATTAGLLPFTHTDRFLVEMFHNYAFKESISVENLKLWLLILTKTLFLITILIKLTLGNIFIKVKKSARAAPLSQNSWYIFQMQITPLLRRPQGPQGCLEKRNCPLSSNLAVWCAKIGPKTQKLQKSVKKTSFCCCFSCHFWGFSNIQAFRSNFSALNYQIQTQWMILLL